MASAPHPILIEDAAAMPRGRVQLKLEVPVALKRALALKSINEGVTMLSVAQRALEHEVADLIGFEPDPTTEGRASV